jgi:hypothetical protein
MDLRVRDDADSVSRAPKRAGERLADRACAAPRPHTAPALEQGLRADVTLPAVGLPEIRPKVVDLVPNAGFPVSRRTCLSRVHPVPRRDA